MREHRRSSGSIPPLLREQGIGTGVIPPLYRARSASKDGFAHLSLHRATLVGFPTARRRTSTIRACAFREHEDDQAVHQLSSFYPPPLPVLFLLPMNQHDHLLKPGTLWPTLLERTGHARDREAILSIPTTPEVIEQSGVAFQVRVITALAMKALAIAAQPDANPFLPYDPDLFVTEVSPTHVALLNKFNVVDHHLLIVTRSFEPQETLLTSEDCAALLICLAEIDGLSFYNAGPAAGASQRHKHLQLIPLPASIEPRLPIEPLLRSVKMAGATGLVPGLPFLHAYAPMDPEWIDHRGTAPHRCFPAITRCSAP